MYKLVVVGGKLRGKEFVLASGENVVGSAGDCAVHLPVQGVSKYHASVTVAGDVCYLKDLNSTNGTFVGGQAIREKTVHDKTRIAVPDTILQVVYVKERVKVVRRVVDDDDSEGAFYEGGEPPRELAGRALHFFKYRAMSILHGINQEWEWRVLFAILLTLFSIVAVTLVIYPILNDNRRILLLETAKRGSHYTDEISRLNAGALGRKDFASLNTNFLDLEDGVTSYDLFDLQGRVIRPMERLNQFIQDPFSNEAKLWAERTATSDSNLVYKKLLDRGRIGIAQQLMAFDTRSQRYSPIGIISIIFEPNSLQQEAVNNSSAYLKAVVTIGFVAVFFYGFVYFLSLRPVEEMRFQLEEALRGKRRTLESRYLMAEINPLRGSVNAALQRIRDLDDQEDDEQEAEDDSSYVAALREVMIGAGVPAMVMDSEKNVQAINTEAEDATGIRQSSSEGMSLLDVSREKGFSAIVLELCENSAGNGGSNQQGSYELSGVNYTLHVSALMGKDGFAKAFYVTFIRE